MRGHLEFHHPARVLPPHGIKRPEQVTALACAMRMRGWVGKSLIGYRLPDGQLQLLSGTHRRAAALWAGVTLPVIVYPSSLVARCWGRLNRWLLLMQGRL